MYTVSLEMTREIDHEWSQPAEPAGKPVGGTLAPRGDHIARERLRHLSRVRGLGRSVTGRFAR
jgi:hypothetical protein